MGAEYRHPDSNSNRQLHPIQYAHGIQHPRCVLNADSECDGHCEPDPYLDSLAYTQPDCHQPRSDSVCDRYRNTAASNQHCHQSPTDQHAHGNYGAAITVFQIRSTMFRQPARPPDMHRKRLFLFSAVVLLLLSCSITANPQLPVSIPILSGGPGRQPEAPVVILPASSNPTPTPFLPSGPTAVAPTPSPIPTAPWAGFPGPSVPPNVPVPPPVDPIEQPAGQINVLLLGSDQRPNSGGYRTDTIVLLTMSPNLGKASITSFPRDLYVYIPGWTMQRINTAHAHGGFDLTQDTFEYNFGVRPDFYALINFWSFVQLVDSLGGINVSVAVSLTDHRDGHGNFTVPAGVVTMDGETALWYVRSRYTTSDFERTRRQQEVLIAIFYKMVSLNGLQRAPELYDLYKNNVTTNATFSDIAPLMGLAAEMSGNTSNLSTYQIDRSQVTSYTTNTGAAVLLPDYDAIMNTLKQALYAP